MKPTFSLRTLLGVMLLAAILFGWYASTKRYRLHIVRLQNRLTYAEEELDRAKDRAKTEERRAAGSYRDATRLFYYAKLDGISLRGTTLTGSISSFQGTSFQDCDLQKAKLSGTSSSFQGARFDRGKLAGSQLTGGGAAFQLASFASADLTGAILTGGPGSFQGATFEEARLESATIRLTGDNFTAFQGVNISGVQLQGADLSALHAEALRSCYFRIPPTYDGQTQLPAGFDAAAQGWQRVE